jgi:hypothetical protein
VKQLSHLLKAGWATVGLILCFPWVCEPANAMFRFDEASQSRNERRNKRYQLLADTTKHKQISEKETVAHSTPQTDNDETLCLELKNPNIELIKQFIPTEKLPEFLDIISDLIISDSHPPRKKCQHQKPADK